MTAPVWVRPSLAPPARAMPKSVTLTWPAAVMSTLPGLTSRCTTPLRVRERERGGDVGADLGGLAGVRAGRVADDVAQRAAVDVLHDDEVRAVLLAPVVDRDDVGVVQVGRGLRLAPEPLDERRVAGELGREHLERDRAVEQLVAGQVHLGHAAPGDARDDLVAVGEDGRRGWVMSSRQRYPSGLVGTRARRRFAAVSARIDVTSSAPSEQVTQDLRRRSGRRPGRRSPPSPWSPPFSMITATAYCGASAGANADEPRVRGAPLAGLRGAGLARHRDARDLRPTCRCPRRRPATMKSRIVAAVVGRHRGPPRFGVDRRSTGLPSSSRISVGDVRAHDCAAVGDRRRDQRHLQRRRGDLALADAGEREQRLVLLERPGAGPCSTAAPGARSSGGAA